ncbi:uncharacterized protein [Procambarus clarkii]|uniref:uncharacterized protein isoform X3 n=1 Tax=Procambarus clarkii TaxID=6728 RepID=UPI0037432369
MDSFRSPQDTAALLDVAYVIRFGHFPSDDGPHNGLKTSHLTTSHPLLETTDISPSPVHSIASDDNNPFSDESLFIEDQNPFTDEPNSSVDDTNPFTEDDSQASPTRESSPKPDDDYPPQTSPARERSSPMSASASPSTPPSPATPTFPTPPSPATPTFPTPPSPATPTTPTPPSPATPTPPAGASRTLEISGVSRAHVMEVITQAFNVTRLDLRRLVEDIGNSKEVPAVELMLEEIRTEGLALEHTTADSPSPPVVFVRAVMGGEGRFTTFSSTSATKVTHNTLTMGVKNMYTETLLLEVWKAGIPAVVEEAQTSPVMDILGRLIIKSIRNRRDKANASASSRVSDESAASTEPDQKGQSSDVAADERSVVQEDEVDHSDDTPIINVSLWENKHQSDPLQPPHHDSTKTAKHKVAPRIVQVKIKKTVVSTESVPLHNDSTDSKGFGSGQLLNGDEVDLEGSESHTLDISDTISINSELSPDTMMTSTPRGRSASVQNLDLPRTSDKASERNKLHKGGFKMSASNFRASLRSSIRKLNHNSSLDSKDLQNKPSLRSKTSDASSTDNGESGNYSQCKDGQDSPTREKENLDKNSSQITKENVNNNLDRERSRSTLSVTSFSKINFGIRKSSQKATEIFRRIGSKRDKKCVSETSTPELRRQQLPSDNISISSFQMESVHEGDHTNGSLTPDNTINTDQSQLHTKDAAAHGSPMITCYMRKSFKKKFSTPRTLRAFRSLRDKGNTKKQSDPKYNREGYTTDKLDESDKSLEAPLNPPEIQTYLSGIGKGHLKAERLAHVSVPVKSLIGTWRKEGWLPLILNQDKDNSVQGQKKKKSNKVDGNGTSKTVKKEARMACKIHIRLTLLPPDSDLTTTSYDTYSATLRKLIDVHVQTLDTLDQYKGSVGVVGDVLLQQLVFFSRVSEPHRTLARWLVMVEIKPSDPGLLLPLLQAIRTHLEAGLYLTTQKRQLGSALSRWVRKALLEEFEMLHSSFPSTCSLIELPRLENFLRCFNTVENCYELRVLFEREMVQLGLPSLTDQLHGALSKHVETWVEALNKEKVKRDSDASLVPSQAPGAFMEWRDAQRRATILTKPILNFLTISFHTYQPIFMIELSVDYLYLVMPKMLTAALHLLLPLLAYDVHGASQVPPEVTPSAAQAAWVLTTNLSQINMIGIESRLPQHLIPQEYRDAFSTTLLHWLVFSKLLALEEVDRDIQKDEFVAVDDMEGYSQSAVGCADLLKALMERVREVRWPGDTGPSGATLTKVSQQVMDLAAEYTNKVTHHYTGRQGNSGTISKQVCVVVRNVEHVCNEVRKHLLHLATMAQDEVAQQLQEHTRHLQEHIDYAAEVLLQRCLPQLEQILTQAVSQGSSTFIIKELEVAMEPVEDRLYFAEPLLHQMWLRLFQHATLLMSNYIQGNWREDLRRLRSVLAETHTFLTNQEGVGLQLHPEVNKEFETLQAELKILGATSQELISQFYHERYQEQLREGESAARTLIVNAALTEVGLRVHVVQAPGGQPGGALVKVRLEPQEWFPLAEPCKTHLAKGSPAVFNEIFRFPDVMEDRSDVEQGGVLTLQLRTPRLLGTSIVHCEAVLPLAQVLRISESNVLSIQHLRLPLTRPWKLTSYKPLEALKTRALDKSAVDFLKVLSERWEPKEASIQIQESQKLRATLARASNTRNSIKGARKPPLRSTLSK